MLRLALATALLVVTPALAQRPAPPSADLPPSFELAEPLRFPIMPPPQEKPAAEKPAGPVWTASLAGSFLVTDGNSERRNFSTVVDAQRESGPHRTTGKFTWDYAETRDRNPLSPTFDRYVLDQRRTYGSLKQDYFLAEKTYLFAEGTGMSNFNQDIAARWTATAGIGFEVFQTEGFRVALEVGAGYYSERSRVAGNPEVDEFTGRAGLDIDWKISETWEFLHDTKLYKSLEDTDELFLTADTRLQANITDEGLIAQVQWIMDYDNTPPINEFGVKNEPVDHRILLTIGWKF